MAGKSVALIFEDEDDWVDILQEALGMSFAIEKAKSLEKVHSILDSNKGVIEIALVDININTPTMAKISGLDVMVILNREGIPCIAATSHDDGITIRDALVVGKAEDVWFKQDKLVSLREKINLVLENKKKALNDQKGMFISPSFPAVDGVIDPKLVFVLMPFSEEWSDDVQLLIKTVGKKHKLNIIRADDIFGPRKIINDIWQSINKAGLIIADISAHNANVFYELGIAHTLGKEVILTRKKDGVKSPFDISSWRYIEYELNPVNAEKFKDALSREFKEYATKNNIS
ncbi:MAG: hypothetical protein IH589_01320 [Anaerolineales bacterium]|nr:hypothetical protein [Anaerolineales bacterium]